jgi:seryl-tRNA synthetase
MNYQMRKPAEMTMDDLFQSSGIDGVRARTELYERVVEGLGRFITSLREPNAEILRFPPVTNRSHIEKSGYLHSFPNLLGAVCCLHGSEQEIRAAVDKPKTQDGWVGALGPTDLVLTPAACYPLYPLIASRGAVPTGGLLFDVAADCFRREPSRDVDRFQSFRMREFVYAGLPDNVFNFRERWMARAPEIADALGVKHKIEVANDPFFGRSGKLMAINQLEQAAKFEFLLQVRDDVKLTACMSFNYHKDHFGAKWGLRTESGNMIHTACTAFGIDRMALALFAAHGLALQAWPKHTREALGI